MLTLIDIQNININKKLMKSKSKKLDFNGINIYTGIDTHLKSWKVTIMIEDVYYKTLSIDPNGAVLSSYLKKNFPNGNYYSAYEAGFCGYSVHRELEKSGIKNIIVNPADIPTTDKERKQKDDVRDSIKIARSLQSGDLEAIYIPSVATQELRSLVRYRKSIVKDLSRNKNRIKSFLYLHGIKIPVELDSASRHWSSNFTKWLKNVRLSTNYGHHMLINTINTVTQLRNSLLDVNKELRIIGKTEQYANTLKLLTSIPGIGLIVAMTIISELENIMRFKNLDKLCSYIGLIPTTNSSGENERNGSVTPRSNKPLRNVIVESAWIAIRNDPAMALAYSTLCKRMKPNKAIIRIAKKLLNRVSYVLKNQTEYKYAIK
jgi:transposase